MRQPLQKAPLDTPFFEGDTPRPFAFAWVQWFQKIITLFAQSFRTEVQVTKDYTAQPGDVIFVYTTLSDVAITLPLAAQSQNGEITITKVSADSNRLIVAASDGDQVNGAPTQTATSQFTVFRLGSDGNSPGNWYPV